MKCLNCLTTTNNPSFCSRSCSASFNNRKFPKRGSGEQRLCDLCANKLHWNQRRFCSKTCESEHRFISETIPAIEQGLVTTPQTLKRFLLKTRINQCEVCKSDPVHNGKPLKLEMDHIDGNSDNCVPSNLRLICPNCHSQQQTSIGGVNNKKFAKRNLIMHRRKM